MRHIYEPYELEHLQRLVESASARAGRPLDAAVDNLEHWLTDEPPTWEITWYRLLFPPADRANHPRKAP